MMINSRSASSFAPAGYRFPREVIAVAVRWYLRYGLSYRDVEELLAERGIVVDHVTVYRCPDVHGGVHRRGPTKPTRSR
jgi:transposase-like protein